MSGSEVIAMVDKNTRNCNLVKRITDILFVAIGAFLAQAVSDNFLNGSFVWNLIILVVFLFIITPLKISIDSGIDQYYMNKDKQQ